MLSSPTSPATDRSPDMIDIHYLNELMSDKAILDTLPNRLMMHVARILDQEIVNVRHRIFDCNFGVEMQLPDPVGEPSLHRKKIYIPSTGGHFNYVGRLLGPRGKTLKSIEQATGVKIMIRGYGSNRPTYAPPMYHPGSGLSPQNSTHFNKMLYSPSPLLGNDFFQRPQQFSGEIDPLHILIQCDDTANRADVRISLALSLIEKLFAPVDDAHDELKHKQLLELSLLRGTFKPSTPQRSNVTHNSGIFFPNGQKQRA
jgi:protein quaking